MRETRNGVSAIFLALYRRNKEAAREIAQKKRVLDVFEAAAIGDLNQLKTTVDKDSANVSSYSPDSFTALALASYLGQKASVEYLIEKGRGPECCSSERNRIHRAHRCRFPKPHRNRKAASEEWSPRKLQLRGRIHTGNPRGFGRKS